MSSSQPPGGSHGPEYLEQGGGAPFRSDRERTSGGRSGRRTGVLVGAGVAVLALVGGGVWAATSFLGTGAQPAEALPGTTLGYLSVDLDPSASQKIEALRTLRKFPAFRDKVGLSADDDVRRKIFDEIEKQAHCQGLDYADDVEPWLGDRAAVAAVDTGAAQPAPVFVVQVKDTDGADAGLGKLRSCGGDGATAGWSIHDGWAVIAQTDAIAKRVATDAARAPLSDNTDFQHWAGEVGDPGIVSMYAAPSAGTYLADSLGQLGALGTGATSGAGAGEALKDFKGAAATVRFNDGSLELELAIDSAATGQKAFGGTRGDDVLATLPTDTAAAFGAGFSDGWFTTMTDQMSGASGGDTKALLSALSEQTGLDLPGDAETLAGKSLAIGVGSGFDPETLANSGDGSGVPVAVKVQGDVTGIEGVLDKVRGRMGGGTTPLDSDSAGDMVVVGPDAAYRKQVLADGGLGSSEAFTRVVPQAKDSSAVLFVNFDAAGGSWLTRLASGDRQVEDNLKPLQALGLSGWQDGATGHALLRLTTN